MNFFNTIIGMGATVMMPIIFFLLGLVFKVGPGKAFKAGMTVGIGFTGINMVVTLLLESLGPAAQDMATRFGLKLTIVDAAGKLVQQADENKVICQVTNTGHVAGKEIVQVYLAPSNVAEDEPLQELVGFEKLFLEPGKTKEVEISLEHLTAGSLRIGASSRDIRLEVLVN